MQSNENFCSQVQQVKKHLEKGHTMTAKQAILAWGIYRLADVIYRLRKMGYEIDTELVPNKKNHRSHARYRMLNTNQQVA